MSKLGYFDGFFLLWLFRRLLQSDDPGDFFQKCKRNGLDYINIPPCQVPCECCFYRNNFILFTINFGKVWKRWFSLQCSQYCVSTLTEQNFSQGMGPVQPSYLIDKKTNYGIFFFFGKQEAVMLKPLTMRVDLGERRCEKQSWTVLRNTGYPAGCSDPVREPLRQMSAQFFPLRVQCRHQFHPPSASLQLNAKPNVTAGLLTMHHRTRGMWLYTKLGL